MAEEQKKREHVPAYVSYPTLERFVQGFKGDVGVPHHIDKSLMRNLSGAVQSHLMASLKFLGLIANDGTVKPEFSKLANADPSTEWPKTLRRAIDSAYRDFIGADQISGMTPKTLQEKFRDAGATGSTNAKAIRFYLAALKRCNLTVPKHLATATAGAAAATTRKKNGEAATAAKKVKTPENGAGATDRVDKEEQQLADPPGSESFPVYLGAGRQGRIVFPADMSEAECDKFTAAIIYLKALVK